MTASNYFKQTNTQITILTTLARRNMLAYGTFGEVGVKLQTFSGPSDYSKWRVDIPIFVAFTSREHVNL